MIHRRGVEFAEEARRAERFSPRPLRALCASAVSPNARDKQAGTKPTVAAPALSNSRLLISAALVFLVAFGVRLLMWQDARLEAGRVQTAVTENYRHMARLLAASGPAGFFSPASPAADPDTLGHPPGYPLVLALLGQTDSRARLLQIAADSLAAVLTLLLASELLSRAAGLLAGLFAALSPQFAWNSVLLLPDTLAVLPLVAAAYCLALAARRERPWLLFAAGALVGLSCWLRANALLAAPFLGAAALLLFDKERRARYALLVIAGAALVVAPLTLRNAVVFGAFIPVSLGAGQTALEGIADYDAEGRFGIPATDLGIMRQEAEREGRPEYLESLFGPDAVRRDRARLARAWQVVSRNPFWFASVMARRALSMLRLERARTISPRPQVTSGMEAGRGAERVWSVSAVELAEGAQALSPRARSAYAPGSPGEVILTGDESKDGPQLALPAAEVEAGTDYLFEVPLAVERGRMTLAAADAETGAVLASTIIEAGEVNPGPQLARLPFVSAGAGRVRLVFSNAPSEPPGPVVHIARAGLFKLGPASLLWARPARVFVAAAQKLFVTAVMLPLALAGLAFAAAEGRRAALVVLMTFPAYYFCVQSALHTEYRYVLAIHHFLFALAAFGLWRIGVAVARRIGRRGRA
ncbi:MAG TPA: glycosyltransferase family 39 protein [Pyrinomonadaceae bacterium]|nr:glycosyltransferase family 39 protein [Pyrinomonadaceae bacterium]